MVLIKCFIKQNNSSLPQKTLIASRSSGMRRTEYQWVCLHNSSFGYFYIGELSATHQSPFVWVVAVELYLKQTCRRDMKGALAQWLLLYYHLLITSLCEETPQRNLRTTLSPKELHSLPQCQTKGRHPQCIMYNMMNKKGNILSRHFQIRDLLLLFEVATLKLQACLSNLQATTMQSVLFHFKGVNQYEAQIQSR